MNKNFTRKVFVLSVAITLNILSYSQTLVNLFQVDTLGQPTPIYQYFTVYWSYPDTGVQLVLGASNEYIAGITGGVSIELIVTGPTPYFVWDTAYSSPDTTRVLYATSVYQKGNYAYFTGFALNQSNNTANWNTFKLNLLDGSVVWTATHTSSYGGYNVPAEVIVDDTGNVYVCGADQTGALTSQMTVVKYDSTGAQKWVGGLTGIITGAVGMQLSGSNVVATGFSGLSTNAWDFATASFSTANGSLVSAGYSSNQSGNFSEPIGVVKDAANDYFVAGTSAVSGSTQLKIVAYDSLFNQLWVDTFGDTLMPTQAAAMTQDDEARPIVTGYDTKTNGATEIFVARYELDGTPDFIKTMSAQNPAYSAQGVAVAEDFTDMNIYVASKEFNGGTWDMLTSRIDTGGNVVWTKRYKRASNTNDVPMGILASNGLVIVSAASYGPDSMYEALFYNQWGSTPCSKLPDYSPPPCPTITYDFENGQITTAGTDTFIEFDIYARQNVPSLLFSAANIYFTYSNSVFGSDVIDSSNITVTRGTIIADTNFVFSLTDTLLQSDAVPAGGGEVQLSIACIDSGHWYAIPDTLQQLCHVKMKRKARGNPGINFDQFFMEGQSFFYDQSILQYTYVYTGGSFQLINRSDDDVGITYQIDPTTITLTTTEVTFHVQAQASNPSSVVAPYQDGTIAIVYSTPAFIGSMVSNGQVSFALIGDGAATDNSGNPLYFASAVDDSGSNEFIISIIPSTNYDEGLAPQITTGPGFDDILSVTMHIANCADDGGIGLNGIDMNNGPNDYYDVTGVFTAINYNPVNVDSSPSTLTDTLCAGCSGRSITGIATSLNPTPGTSVSIPSGTQDELLIVTGCGFGSSAGTVLFQDADQDAAYPFTYTNPLDIELWSDNQINLYVPSTIGSPYIGGHGAGSGPFRVITASNDTIDIPNDFTFFIPYAVQNLRTITISPVGTPIVLYLEQQSEIAPSGYGTCYGDTSSSNPCHTNGYLFTFQDPNNTNDSAAFPSAQFTNVQASFSRALEEWVCNTGVNFTLNTLLDGLNTGVNPFDFNNMVLSMPPDGSAAVLPYSANAATHGNPASPCQTSVIVPGTSITHTFYVAAITDIDIVFNNTTTANPPASGNPENYDYVLNDYSGIASNQHPFSTIALHELGHASGLDHVLPGSGEVMYYACGTGASAIISSLTDDDITGGKYVLSPVGKIYATTTNCTDDANHGSNSYSFCGSLGIRNPGNETVTVQAYPNPFDQSLNIDLELSEAMRIDITIYNVLGQLIYSNNRGNLEPGTYSYNLQLLPETENGIYLLKIGMNNEVRTFKLIKL